MIFLLLNIPLIQNAEYIGLYQIPAATTISIIMQGKINLFSSKTKEYQAETLRMPQLWRGKVGGGGADISLSKSASSTDHSVDTLVTGMGSESGRYCTNLIL